jgi:hypothetical protein
MPVNTLPPTPVCKIVQVENDSPHSWAVAVAECNLANAEDLLVDEISSLVRRSYGEDALVADAKVTLESEIAGGEFETSHLVAAIRRGLPNPAKEGDKPAPLTTYRSQSAEMVARAALTAAYALQFPAAPQAGAVNSNMPILGFDGWAVLESSSNEFDFALIQVKATDVSDSPPSEAYKLAAECVTVPREEEAICRALTVLASLLRGDPFQSVVLRMLTKMARGNELRMLVAPVIVRGVTIGALSDLEPIKVRKTECAPAYVKGVVVSIGVSLNEFGLSVMNKARTAQ